MALKQLVPQILLATLSPLVNPPKQPKPNTNQSNTTIASTPLDMPTPLLSSARNGPLPLLASYAPHLDQNPVLPH